MHVMHIAWAGHIVQSVTLLPHLFSFPHTPEVPEEEMADGLALQCPLKQELPQGAVQVGLKLEHLHQLKQVHVQLVVTRVGGGKWSLVCLPCVTGEGGGEEREGRGGERGRGGRSGGWC